MKTSLFVRVLYGTLFFAALAVLGAGLEVHAQGMAMGLQTPVTDSAQRIHDFHDMLLYIITGIVIFVMVLLLIVIVRFNAKANPVPSKTTHNVMLEIVWTIIPVVILIIIAVPSFKLLYKNERIESPEMTLKVTGAQWYWIYDYPDNGEINFQSYMIPVNDIDSAKGQKRLVSTDNKVVLPVGVNIQALVTSGPADVIHSWAMPSFGIKIDAVPGRINHTWFRINKPGIYYGQCSELCGKDHSFMPIEVWAVEKPIFDEWAAMAKDDVDKAQEWIQTQHNPALNATAEPVSVPAAAPEDNSSEEGSEDNG